jgi:hypothetical protein
LVGRFCQEFSVYSGRRPNQERTVNDPPAGEVEMPKKSLAKYVVEIRKAVLAKNCTATTAKTAKYRVQEAPAKNTGQPDGSDSAGKA